jgi:site-specific DNA-methyltransferase (adenine-specific)
LKVHFKCDNGRIIHGDNIEVLSKFKGSSVDSCISDFPYDLSFMGRKWDNTGDFYKWCNERAIHLFRVMKPGGYVCIFGHPKTNHRMKCAFEDAGFNIVEEIDWVYLNGFPKVLDIGKLFDKSAGLERDLVGYTKAGKTALGQGSGWNSHNNITDIPITLPKSDLANQWDGWKTSGLKPAHETITVFQKPLEGTYIQNIEKYGCGAMNIGVCRVPCDKNDRNYIDNAGGEEYNFSQNVYGDKRERKWIGIPEGGRFPPNMMFDEEMAKVLDEQTGVSKSSGGVNGGKLGKNIYGNFENDGVGKNAGGLGDTGGSRMFPIFKYCPKSSPKERLLPNGERNPHVTLKPVELIKWLIRLVTPNNGITMDITAGSCTHAVACELLNRDEGYNLKWFDIEINNTEDEPYCDVGKMRVESINL